MRYRFWDYENEQMGFSDDSHYFLTLSKDGELELSVKYEEDKWKQVYHFEVMKPVGIKDKNGNEVYESDILDFDINQWGDRGFTSLVIWDKENLCWDFGGGTVTDVSQWRAIVGNLYEKRVLSQDEKIKIFRDLWYSRNPTHYENVDNGKDMFWETAMIVAEEYVEKITPYGTNN